MESNAESLTELVARLAKAFENSLDDILAEAQPTEERETKGN